MRSQVGDHLIAVMAAHRDFVTGLPDGALAADLAAPSNSVGSQLWCVVGARESFARAIAVGEWSGFDCSLASKDRQDRAAVLAALERASRQVLDVMSAVEWTPERDDLLLTLLEHEYQHQGQLIRYGYAVPLRFPPSWKDKWGLADRLSG